MVEICLKPLSFGVINVCATVWQAVTMFEKIGKFYTNYLAKTRFNLRYKQFITFRSFLGAATFKMETDCNSCLNVSMLNDLKPEECFSLIALVYIILKSSVM